MAQTVLAEKNSSDDATGGLNIASNLIKFQNAAGTKNEVAKMTGDAVELKS